MNTIEPFVLHKKSGSFYIPILIDEGYIRTIKEQILGTFIVEDIYNKSITIGVYAAYTDGQPAIEYDVALVNDFEEIPNGFFLNDYVGEIRQDGILPSQYFLFMKRRIKHD